MSEYLKGVAAIVSRRGADLATSQFRILANSLGGPNREAVTDAIGSAALMVAPFSSGSATQPASGGGGRYRLILDGRLDYRDELSAKLGISVQEGECLPGCALAMRSFEKWGEDAIHHLEGNFALIVWDAAEQRLFAARDPTGYFPLSYHLSDDLFVIASLPKVIFGVTGARRDINFARMASRVAGLVSEPCKDVYEGLSRLPAGHALVLDRQGLRLRRHWTLNPAAPLIKLTADDDYAAAGRAHLDRAVSMALQTEKGVGADLTGGLDSSAVTVTALQLQEGRKRLPVFTHAPEGGWDGRVEGGRYGDETPYVRDIAAMHPRLEPNFLTSADRSWDHGLRDLIERGEVVPGLPRWLSVWEQTFQAAQSKGLSVVLNGGGGNIGLSWEGRGAFLAWFRSGHWRTLCRELAAISSGPKAFVRAMASRVIVPAGPPWLWRLYMRYKYGPATSAWTRFSFVNPDVAITLQLDSRAEELGAEFMRLRDYRAIRAKFLMADDPERAELCRMARVTHGVDYRSPLQDRRLLEWCMRVPEEQYWRNGKPRWLMRRIMAGRLPESVVNNRTRGSPGADWHFQMTRQLPFIREQVEVLSADPDVAALIDFPRIRRMLDEWPAQTPVDADDPLSYLLPAALPHALAVGQFIRWTKGANL